MHVCSYQQELPSVVVPVLINIIGRSVCIRNIFNKSSTLPKHKIFVCCVCLIVFVCLLHWLLFDLLLLLLFGFYYSSNLEVLV